MLSFEEALDNLLAAAPHPAASETLELVSALGRVLATDVFAGLDVPPQDNSAMDGYALRAADGATGEHVLRVTQRIAAGSVGGPLAAGEAARIFTGAPIPPGADTVAMQEYCEVLDNGARVRLLREPVAGENLRRRGEDIRDGSLLLRAGTVLGPAALGLLASVGIARVLVFQRLKVALFSTGDELLTPGEPPRPGAIYNSNRYQLHALLQRAGCEVWDLGIVRDDLDATRAALREAALSCDVILTSGGVSVGEEDHVKHAVRAEGSLDLWKIAIKPGKPFAHGTVGRAGFIGLPGNPVAAYVTFLMLVLPYLRRRQGQCVQPLKALPMRADFRIAHGDPRREFLRVRRKGDGGLELFPNQGSAVLSACVWADGLVELPPGATVEPGDTVRYLPLEGLLG